VGVGGRWDVANKSAENFDLTKGRNVLRIIAGAFMFPQSWASVPGTPPWELRPFSPLRFTLCRS
jgi:hypothetical protein